MKASQRVPLSQLRSRVGEIDSFVTSASYEARCLAVAKRVGTMSLRESVICSNSSLSTNPLNQISALRELLPASRTIEYDRANPLDIADVLKGMLESLDRRGKDLRLLVDITTFTHEGLLILIQLLKRVCRPSDCIWFVYVIAEQYGGGGDSPWLSKGIGDIRSILGFPGLVLPSRAFHLIVLAGFELERAARVVDEYEPVEISLGFVASGSRLAPFSRLPNDRMQADFLSRFHDVRTFEFDCFDAEETAAAILRQAGLVRDMNTIVAPMNTKVSAIGAALAGFADESLQLTYVRANTYNYESYSIASEDCILVDGTSLLFGRGTPGV